MQPLFKNKKVSSGEFSQKKPRLLISYAVPTFPLGVLNMLCPHVNWVLDDEFFFRPESSYGVNMVLINNEYQEKEALITTVWHDTSLVADYSLQMYSYCVINFYEE